MDHSILMGISNRSANLYEQLDYFAWRQVFKNNMAVDRATINIFHHVVRATTNSPSTNRRMMF